ncbi:MAG TPA: endolytic transglycosylase MltG [Myxococcaceae bacterium]|nr:endolytic transglycosylase MltG [Myxococcaceae bacterium]
MRTWLKRLAVVAVLLALTAGGLWFVRQRQLTQFAQEPFGAKELVTVVIPPGTGPRGLGQLLAERGVVRDGDLFYRLVRREKAGPKLKAGEYEFAGPLTPMDVLERVLSGQVKVYRFTVPEGLRVDEILPLLLPSGLKLEAAKLAQLTEDPAFLRKLGVPARTLEGFLFPDTYTFTRSADEKTVLSKMVARTLEEYRKADAARSPAINLDFMQTLTLASIIEKETGAKEERPRISCVFHNRLKRDMKLQTDPTVLYAMKLLRGQFVKNISLKDLTTDHPYNTYTRKGLPPGPIASPGAQALQAALNPIACNDLYFVSRNDGTHVFCPTLECHNAAVEAWQRAFFRKQKKTRTGKRG